MRKDRERPLNLPVAPAFFTLLMGLSLLTLTHLYDVSFIQKDAAQSVSVAKNLLAGEGLVTSLVWDDEHYLIGGVPAPQPNVPPGYPLLIALVSKLGVDPRYAAFLVALTSFNLIPLLLYRILRMSGHGQIPSLALSAAWFGFPLIWFNVLACLSETTYALFTLISATCVMQSEHDTSNRGPWLFLAGTLGGLTFMLRYVGISYVISLGAFFLLRAVRQRDRQSIRALFLVGTPASLLVLAVFLRNYFLMGKFTGGLLYGSTPVGEVLHSVYWSLSELLGFSLSGLVAHRIPELLLVIFSLGGLLLLLARAARLRISWPALRALNANTTASLSLIYVLGTLMVVGYAATTHVSAHVSSRYLLPLIPFVLLLLPSTLDLAQWESSGRRHKTLLSLCRWGALVVLLAGQMNVVQHHWDKVIRDNPYRKIVRSLQEPFGSATLFDFLTEMVTRNSPLLGNEPQMLGAVLDRPVVGLTPSSYTRKIWSGDEVKGLVVRYGVSYVLFLPDFLDLSDDDSRNQIFFRELQDGNIPSWLEPTFASAGVRLYHVNTSGLTASSLEPRHAY